MQKLSTTILSQYANSPVLLALIDGMNDAIDPSARINDWYRLVWNIDTAQGYGLDLWGRILGITRFLKVPLDIDYFGFQTGGIPEHSLPFGSGVFYSGTVATSNFALSDTAYRNLLFFKAFVNIAATNTPTLDKLINKLFAGVSGFYVVRDYAIEGYFEGGEAGRAYVEDLGDMQMRYVFQYDLTPPQLAIINTPGVLPRPTGVKVFIG